MQVLHMVFELFYALLMVCAIRGLSLHAFNLWSRVQDTAVGARSGAERVELRVD
jgi:hypothetical protein